MRVCARRVRRARIDVAVSYALRSLAAEDASLATSSATAIFVGGFSAKNSFLVSRPVFLCTFLRYLVLSLHVPCPLRLT